MGRVCFKPQREVSLSFHCVLAQYPYTSSDLNVNPEMLDGKEAIGARVEGRVTMRRAVFCSDQLVREIGNYGIPQKPYTGTEAINHCTCSHNDLL